MLAHDSRIVGAIGTLFVNVVTGVEHEIEVLGGEMPIRREVARLVLAAPADREPKPIDRRADCRRGHGTAGLAHLTAGVEPVEVFAAGLESADLGTNTVAQLGPGNHHAPPCDRLERRIARDLPAQFDGRGRHAAAFERIGREARPQHHPVRQRLAGRDAKREWIRPELRLGK